ncbi:MAG: efflux transporter outer membrane subunit [Sedimentisphaerales bacterium]|nr:efflux transporter outer membrane subunit [Sedimentisphaerales bacterium]
MLIQIPDTFTTMGTEPMQEKWWRAFDDNELNDLIDQALTNNFDLQVAWDRLVQTRALAEQTNATLWPQASLAGEVGRTRQEANGAVNYTSLYSVGVAASYEVDLWSQLRSTQQAAWLDVEAQRDAIDTAAITLAASIANTWYQLAEAKALARIARDQIKTNQDVLKIVTVQWRKGAAGAADVYRQRQLVASTEAQLITAEETVELLQYALSVLIGEKPGSSWQQTSIELPTLPPIPKLGVPTDVLLRRPDVRQSYRQVQAADQRLAIAIADQYPSLRISAYAETTSTVKVSDLFDDWLANLAANAVQPIFDKDLRKAEVRRQEAIVSQRIHAWSQTILDALEEVESAITRERQQKQLIKNLEYRLELARLTYRRNQESYMKGQVDYIRVLESLESLQALERNIATARRTFIQRRIDLYRSIAGPCELQQPELAQIRENANYGIHPE